MFAEEPGPKVDAPYIPGYIPGQSPTYLPGSAYDTYGQPGMPIYGSGARGNIVEERYTALTEQDMGGVNMFAGNHGLGTWQESVGAELGPNDYGPPEPTTQQKTGQAIIDTLKADIPLTKMNFYYIVGGAIGIYALWQYFLKDMIADDNY